MFMKIINMFRVGIPPPQLLYQEYIIIINTERNQTKKLGKRGCGGGISTLKMFMLFINRKT